MDQINGIAFYHLGKWLDSIFLSVRMPVKANLGAWQAARTILDVLLAGNAKISLNVSRDAGLTLLSILDVILNSYAADNEFVLSEAQVWNFNNAWGVFESALELDLGRAPIFFVKSKGIYSTAALIANAENALVAEVIAAISEHAKRDLNEAGRCLAFELPTASGYHGLRAVEKVLREYYELVLKKSGTGIGMKQCIDELRSAGVDKKTLAALDQLRDLHRNPIDHPEEFLDLPEALELFNACTNAISKMARQISAVRATLSQGLEKA